MISLVKKDKRLEIASLPESGMSFVEMQSAHDEANKYIKSGQISDLSLDLEKIVVSNYSVMTFLIGCGELCAKNGIKISFSNIADAGIRAELDGLGFDSQGCYHPKKFRKEESKSVFITAGDAIFKFWADTKKLVGFIGEIVNSIIYLIRNPRKLDFKEVVFYMDKSGADGVPIVILICFLIGVILAFQGLSQMMKFGLQIYIADLVSLAIIRELGPLMVAMICIGRAGSAYAAELGTMNVSEEIDAMDTMGLKPVRFLVIPKIIALIIVVPMLVLIGDICGIVGGVLITITMSDISYIEYMNRTLQALVPWNILESLIKAFVFAFIIAGVGCFRGFEADKDAKGVGSATTSAVVSGIFLVIIADFFVTFFYPQILGTFGISY